MVMAERERLIPGKKVLGWKLVPIAALSVCAGVVLVGWATSSEPVELYAKRPLTPEEKKFVAHATSTPDKDLHKAPKLSSKMGSTDMDTFYDHLSKKTVVKDKNIDVKIRTLHKKASTLAAMRDINTYFDKLDKVKKAESQNNLQKETGKGKQARNEINSYFDSLDAQEKSQNEKDIMNLGTGASVAEQAKRRVAALKQKAATNAAAKPAATALKPKIGEDDKAARNEILGYFDQLDAQEGDQNKADDSRLSRSKPTATPKLNSAASDRDLQSYFNKLSKHVNELDKVDKARLRKDYDPVNRHDGVRVAFKSAAVARLRARKARAPRAFH